MSKVTKRLWRDAATVIIAARNVAETSCKPVCSLKSTVTQQQQQMENWLNNRHDVNYKLLMLQRNAKSNFMPDAYVFPGGVIDRADYSDQWLDIFAASGYSENDLIQQFSNLNGSRPPIFDDYKQSPVIPDIAFRICAVREAFEECGVMLLKPNEGRKISALGNKETLAWRKKVHGNASAFLDLCKELGVVPDIWCLREWSNWLTPVSMGRRFDTMFYMCILDDQPYIEHDEKETSDAVWSSPKQLLLNHARSKLWLAPPQGYEMARLIRYQSLEELAEFAKNREEKGVERILPVRIDCADGVVSLIPGDDKYPDDPENFGKENEGSGRKTEGKSNLTLSELRESSKFLNRLEFKSRHDYTILCNNDRFGHGLIHFRAGSGFEQDTQTSKL